MTDPTENWREDHKAKCRVVPSITHGMCWLPEPTCSFAFLSRLALGCIWTTPILCSHLKLKFYSGALNSRKTSRNSSGLANQTSPWHPAYNRNVPLMIRTHRCYHCPHTDSEVCVRTMFPDGHSQTSRKLNRKFTRIPAGFFDGFLARATEGTSL